MVFGIIVYETCEIMYTVIKMSLWSATTIRRLFQSNPPVSNDPYNCASSFEDTEQYHHMIDRIELLENRIKALELQTRSIHTTSSSSGISSSNYEIVNFPKGGKQS